MAEGRLLVCFEISCLEDSSIAFPFAHTPCLDREDQNPVYGSHRCLEAFSCTVYHLSDSIGNGAYVQDLDLGPN